MRKSISPYGSWPSTISSQLIVEKLIALIESSVSGNAIYWLELRPAEDGRQAIVRWSPHKGVEDIIPPSFNARSRVHEYGGGSYLVNGDWVYFSQFADQRLYRAMRGTEPEAITEEGEYRYADAVMDQSRKRLICVREDHANKEQEPVNQIVSIGFSAGLPAPIAVLVAGADFYSNPRLSPDGESLAWLCWDHPNMPWDGTELWVAPVGENGGLCQAQRITGGREESIYQPEWSPDGSLYFISDRTGWWNLYRWRDGRVEAVAAMEADFGNAQWVFRETTYAIASVNQIIASYWKEGSAHLASIDTASGAIEEIPTPYTDIDYLQADDKQAVFIGASPRDFPSVACMDLASRRIEVLRRASNLTVDPGYISASEPIEFPTKGNRTAHGFYYPPSNPAFMGPKEAKPPLLVTSHGGPTSAARNGLKLTLQFFTSRGFAVLDVNYGGSTGFGRAYRERLNGQWGIVDVEDCVHGALYLAAQGRVDRKRLAIRGASAGGYTTLAALTFRDVFSAGASHFGVSDAEALAKETHKFESRYLDKLIGPYPERADLYRERSPIHAAERLSCPVIFFQGLEDKVVPPNQAETMVEALRKKGLPVAYLAFEGEQHGFRQAKNIKRTLDAEIFFYSQVFGFDLAEPVEPVPIENLDAYRSRS